MVSAKQILSATFCFVGSSDAFLEFGEQGPNLTMIGLEQFDRVHWSRAVDGLLAILL